MALLRRQEQQRPVWDPFREMEDLSRRFDQLLGSSWLSSRGDGQRESLSLPEWSPSVDIAETENAYEIKAQLPGVKKEDVKVNLEQGVLTIQGERRQEKEEKDKKLHRVESAYGSFMRRFSLPEDVQEDNIDASYRDGMLMITIPKSEQRSPKARQIDVK